MAKHGASNHFMRPDGVMRSSIVQSVQGFHPVRDAMGVAQEFTVLSGAEGFARGGLWGWFKALRAKRQVRRATPAIREIAIQRAIVSATKPRGEGGPDGAAAAGRMATAMDITRAANATGPWISPPVGTGGPMTAGPQVVNDATDMAALLARRIGSQIPGKAVAAGTRAVWQRWMDLRTGRNGF